MNAIVVPDRIEPRDRQILPMPPNPNATPMQMVAMAVAQNCDIVKLEKLMALAREWEENEARKAFVAAKAAFKKNPPKVIKDMVNTQYKSKYASLGNFVTTVNAHLGEHGLEASWPLKQEGQVITVQCKLSHVLGHSETVELSSPPDTSGAKNPLQQIRSAITYLEMATFQAITGIVAINEDDDGNGASNIPRVTDDQQANIQALIDEVGANKIVFLRYLKVDQIADIPEASYKDVVRLLEDKRKAAK